ncbi:MAG: 3'(2'),5'-bisphosphate nucleotidase [Bacteroidetes bacterium]|nr:3'(2'),5'-bisphosphate nucleotidase [Bacteroidota bacterium]
MSNKTYAAEIEIATMALAEATLLCHSVQGHDAMIKGDLSPVTIADFGSQAVVCRMLREAFPDDPIIAEEDSALLQSSEQAELRQILGTHLEMVRPGASLSDAMKWIDYGNAKTYSDRFWTLDPIDGTKGFLRGGHYAIALALIEDGEVVVCGLACPKLSDQVFFASRGNGAYHGDQLLQVTQTHISGEPRICQSIESGHTSLKDIHRVADYLEINTARVELDSQAKYVVVARGHAEIYMRLPLGNGYIERIWDHAAGALLLSEAGGKVTDCGGRLLDLSCGMGLEKNVGIIATNGVVHDQVIEALESLDIYPE